MVHRALVPRDTLMIGLLASVPFILALALFLAARRAMGAMSAPLPALPLVTLAVSLLLWSWCVRGFSRGPTSGPANTTATNLAIFLKWAPLVSPALVAFACSYPGARFIDWAVWLPTIAAASVGPRPLMPILRRTFPTIHEVRSQPIAAGESTGRVLQQLTRFRTATGGEAVRGTLTAEFAPGERNSTLYVAFCPPFDRLPEVSVDFHDERLAAVKLTQVLHNGAQLDVRLSRAAAAHSAFAIELFAAEPPADQ